MRGTRYITPLAIVGAALLTLVGCAQSVDRNEAGEVTAAVGNADVFALAVGDCFDDTSEDAGEVELTTIPIVPCADPHDVEVYHAFDIADGDFPGQEAIDAEVETCLEEPFTSFVGLAYADSVFEVYPLYPTEASWEQGDREVLCGLYDPQGPTEGSVEGSNR